MNRRYEQKERARRKEQTRERIVEAAVELHTSLGPARTTISGIAERAGVERHTVYAHFPDELTLYRACSSHWAAQHPLPDFEALATIEDPSRRLRRALDEIYGWYDSVELDLALILRDSSVVPVVADVFGETTIEFAKLAEALAHGWPRRKGVKAAIGHTLEFETWRSLVRRQSLTQAQAVETMSRFVASV